MEFPTCEALQKNSSFLEILLYVILIYIFIYIYTFLIDFSFNLFLLIYFIIFSYIFSRFIVSATFSYWLPEQLTMAIMQLIKPKERVARWNYIIGQCLRQDRRRVRDIIRD